MRSSFYLSLLLTSLAPLAATSAAWAQDAAAGERLFRTRCGSCHSVQPGQNRVGPSLSGVVGRKAGSVEGARYSQAMRGTDITWDATQLGTYLANPRGMVPGTSMTVSVPGTNDRGSIVAYLETLKAAN